MLLPGRALEITKADNVLPLNEPGSWVQNQVPGPADVALFDGTIPAPLTVQLAPASATLSWDGIRVTNPGGAVIIGHDVVNTLGIGASGIDMGAATAALLIEGGISINAPQTWSVANASTAGAPYGAPHQFNHNEDLSFSAQHAPAGLPMNLNGHTVSTVGAGTIVVTSGYTVMNGTFVVGNPLFVVQGGANRLTTIDPNVTVRVNAGSTFRLQTNSGPISSAAAIQLNGGTLTLAVNNAVNPVTVSGPISVLIPSTLTVLGGSTAPVEVSGALQGSADLAVNNITTNATPPVLTFSGDNSAYSGTLTVGATSGSRRIRLATPTAGSAAARWVITPGNVVEVDGVSVNFGTLNGAGTVTNSSVNAAALTIGAGTFSGSIQDGVGPMGLTKTGSGTLELTGTNTFTGPVAVQGGTLLTTTAQTGNGAVTVADGATLGLRLASAGARFNASSLTLGTANGSTLRLELGGFGNPTAPVVRAPSFTVNGTNTLTLNGIGLSVGTFTLVDYDGTIGGTTGFAGLTLTPIPRLGAMLVQNNANSSVDLQITNIDFPKWTGAISANWDIDNGTGTGTQNWRETTSGLVTRYVESPTMRDQALFDDSATGSTSVNLTTTISPAGVTVNNSTKTYSFVGPGKLSGSTPLLKQGSGTLILANTGQNDYTGSTTISGGILQVGDGTNGGPGQLGSGPVINDATLVFNRLDNVTVPNNISGTGAISKINVNTTTLSGALTSSGTTTVNEGILAITGSVSGPIAIGNAGTLALESPGLISGVISGAGGGLEARGPGTKQITGTASNTLTSATVVSEGLLQLNKTPGANATSNDLQILQLGQLQLLAPDQIPDTATLTFNAFGPSTVLGNETLANINVIGSSEQTQLQANNGLNITGVLRIETGVFSVASNHSATTGGVNISGGILRIAANGNPSTLNVGALGITATGGTIQVGQGMGAFDAVLNLEGDVTASGAFQFTRGNFFGVQRREINLPATRTFNITADETIVNPDISGLGGLTKTGPGTLSLLGTNSYLGDTTINAGILALNGTLSGSTRVRVNNGGTLAGTGPISFATSGVSVAAGGKLSPGNGLGTLTLTGSSLDISGGADPAAAAAFLFELDVPALSDLIRISGTNTLSIGIGQLEFADFLFTPFPGFTQGTYTLFDGDQPIVGSFGPNRTGPIGNLFGTLAFADGGRDIVLQVIPEPASATLLVAASAAIAGSRRRRQKS